MNSKDKLLDIYSTMAPVAANPQVRMRLTDMHGGMGVACKAEGGYRRGEMIIISLRR